MISKTRINSALFLLFLLFFCIPFIFPQNESIFIVIQFSLIVPFYLIFNFLSAKNFIKFQISIFLFLTILMIIGMPGSIPGWMAMLCIGYLFGIRSVKSLQNIIRELTPFLICSIIMCSWILKDNFNNTFDYDLLSDYFEKSSINTVPILMVCSFNLYCSVLFYKISKEKTAIDFNFNKEFIILFILLFISILSVVSFDFRSGFVIFISSLLIIIKFMRFKLGKLFFTLFILFTGYFIYTSNIVNLLVLFLTQGGDDLFLTFSELSTGALRIDRIIEFWEVSSFSKINFSTWTNHFSVSGMSDFTSALFPLSLIFLLYPIAGIRRLATRTFENNKIVLFIILTCLLSSLIISFLQPDFFSFFSFFSIYTMIYYGEKHHLKQFILK